MRIRRDTTALLVTASLCGLMSACGVEGELADLLRALTNSVDGFGDRDDGRHDGDDFEHHDGEGFEHHDGSGRVELKSFLSGAGSASAKVEYEDKPGETKFEVEVFGGAPDAVLDVAINDFVVGSVTLNQFGNGKVEYTTRPHEFYHQPLPPDFPALMAGDVVFVGEWSGPLRPE